MTANTDHHAPAQVAAALAPRNDAVVDVTPKGAVPAARLDFAEPLAAASHDDRSRTWVLTALLFLAVLGSFCAWATQASLEEVASGNGKVIASRREQVIQSLEGGILAEMLVREGVVVEKGDPLLRIDPTKAQSMFQEGRSRQLALRATAARLRAESQGLSSVRFDAEVAREQELVQSERATFAARVNAVQQAVGGLQRTRVHLQREMQITEPMVAKGLAPEVEAIKLQRQLSEVDLQIAERVNRFRADASTELVKVEAELAQVTEQLMARKDQMERTLIRAPMRGTVKNIRINTNGGVIQPGQDILELVPLDDRLLVEVKIRPSEVAFLRQGLPALVKLSAYDSQIYGSLKGTVQFISPDTLKEDRRPEEENYYRVVVATEQAHLEHQGKHLPVIPGMTAVVDIITGHRTVANYMLKPVLRLKEAFRET